MAIGEQITFKGVPLVMVHGEVTEHAEAPLCGGCYFMYDSPEVCPRTDSGVAKCNRYDGINPIWVRAEHG